MTQPILNYIANFDANNEHTLSFVYLGAERTSTHMVSIREDKPNSKPVYEKTVINYDKEHILDEKTLKNGYSYLAKVRVKIGEEWSEWSPEIKFMCLDTPVIEFDMIDKKNFIYTNDVQFNAVYRQAQSESVVSYQYTLYDQQHVVVKGYPTRTPNPLSPNIFTERISDLIKGKLYYVAVKVVTKHGLVHVHEQQFTPQYIVPSISGILQPKLNEKDAQITIEAFLKQMLGTPVKPFIPNRPTDSDDHYTYWQNDYVVIPKDNPLMFTKLGMAKASDFVVKLWCMDVSNGVMLDWSPELGKGTHIKFIKHDDYITCEKQFGKIKSRTRSNIVEGLGLKPFYLYIYVHEYRIEMRIVEGLHSDDDEGVR